MPRWIGLVSLIAALALVYGCSDTVSHNDGSEDMPPVGKCQIDKNIDFDTSSELAADTQIEGYICPKTDRDYYKVTVPAGGKLLKLSLAYVTTAPKLNMTYTIFDSSTPPKPVETAAPGIFNKFDAVHCVAPGTYYLMLQDGGDDAYDIKNTYTLKYTTASDKDTNEPNDDAAQATALSGSATGYISCQGDKDYFKVNVGADQLFKIALQPAKATPVDLKYSVYDSTNTLVGTDAIPDGSKADAKLEVLQAVPKAGAYTIVIEDKDGDEADADTSYTLTVSTAPEQDPQDKGTRNDTPATATVVGASGGTFTGQIGSKGDVDWFVINGLSGATVNNPGVMEVILSTPAGQQALDPSFSIIYSDSGSACTKDTCCTVLAKTACQDDVDCFRKTYTCINKGDNFCLDKDCSPNATVGCPTEKACAGATSCLPNKFCGAEHAFRVGRNKTTASTVLTSQLLIHPGPWYVRVSDQQDDEYEHGRNYTVSIKVQMDPDGAKELDTELFADRCWLVANISEETRTEWEWKRHVVQAKTKIAAKQIALDQWVQGYLSYEGDIDFYGLPNPCPGADCTLSIDYQPGPGCPSSGAPLRHCQDANKLKNAMGLEFLYTIRRTDDEAEGWTGFSAKAGESGVWGADGSPPLCVYSYKNHGSSPYYITVEDMGQNFWSWSCYYRFRIRKVADGCASPCKTHPVSGNCGA